VRHAGHIDDARFFRFSEPWQEEVREEKRADVIGRVGYIEPIPGQRLRPGDARIVDEDVERVAGREKVVGSGTDRSQVRDVDLEEAGLDPWISVA
jgi:hypothetical protein